MDPNYALLNLSSVLNRIDSKKGSTLTAMALSSNTAARPMMMPTTTPVVTTSSSSGQVEKKQKIEKEEKSGDSKVKVKTEGEKSDSDEKQKDKEESEKDGAEKDGSEKEEEVDPLLGAKPEEIWHEFLDVTSGKRYYHNYHTSQTAWDPPKYFIPYNPAPIPAPLLSAVATPAYQDYRSVGYFNNTNGRYSGNTTYWEKTGRCADKAGRQLSAFIDLNDLEKNRAETKQKKEEFQRKLQQSGVNWKELKEEQKAKKRKARDKWLFEDEC